MLVLIALVLIADTANPSELEKWVGPVLSSTASVFATCFAYMTARDRLKYDARQQIQDSKIKDQGDRIVELEREKDECYKDRARLGKRLGRLMANFQAQIRSLPLPFPKEVGFPTDEDESTDSITKSI